jgi:hypothetical protein
VLVQRPGEPPALLSQDAFLSIWSGELVLMTSQARATLSPRFSNVRMNHGIWPSSFIDFDWRSSLRQ